MQLICSIPTVRPNVNTAISAVGPLVTPLPLRWTDGAIEPVEVT